MKSIIKKFIPPIVFDVLYYSKKSKYGWKGEFSNWESALSQSIGYDSVNILEKVKNSVLKVKNGEAVFERDSVIFDYIQYSWQTLSGILMSSVSNKGKIDLIDFGGSLGSSYFQNKKFLDKIDHVSWKIVEQPNFVEIGKRDFQNERLQFFYTIKECFENSTPNLLLLSSVIQYFENPYKILKEMVQYKFEYIIVDRTPFSSVNTDIIKLQLVNPEIYNASYPCWFFDEKKFKQFFSDCNYELVEEFDAIDGKSKDYYFKGFIFKLN